MEKMTLEKIIEEYWESEVCMGEMLANVPATDLTMEEAFELYIKTMQQHEGDRFFRQINDESWNEYLAEEPTPKENTLIPVNEGNIQIMLPKNERIQLQVNNTNTDEEIFINLTKEEINSLILSLIKVCS